MSPGGVAFLQKVNKMLSRQNGKPVLKPNRPLALRDTVADRKLSKGEASCVTEMSVLMACWKDNNFVDDLCSTEIDSFYTCVKAAQVCSHRPGTVDTMCCRIPPSHFHPPLFSLIV
uniref:Coiled-coil-helix-coiled-coil-helix domain containing 1 n=1 Tax=Scophthalmus maximus TaxID=52904 RepID=A0A8D3BNE0_SCOMX